MILVTGGCGFIGSNFIQLLRAERPERELLNLDALTYAGNLENLAALEDDPGLRFVRGDVADAALVESLFAEHPIDAVVHFAAESHVDRSILGPGVFVETNVRGTQVLLDAARKAWPAGDGRFVMVSTDEVYGSLGPTGRFREDTPLDPSSPYSASKASADLLCQAYHRTFGFPVTITRCSNNYGPYQFPEKLIPLMIQRASQDLSLPVYGDGLQVRDWLHVEDHCRAVLAVLERGEPGRVYNIGGDNERANIDIVRLILAALNKGEDLIEHVTDRPGHDRRYAMDAGRIRAELGWTPTVDFADGIAATIDWYLTHRPWWERILSGDYREYYDRLYGSR
ncbi:MAG: dTDP-glucose 4,6-dehydratase [Candidatus Krumholzibacteriia bacterium]|nr:dTDP-glucose 4,6-dehydratase [bacterium]MCB9515063.1 dTDP-glucose 4,6-dehydratase [Candidatus Latescibacterota bacterium]